MTCFLPSSAWNFQTSTDFTETPDLFSPNPHGLYPAVFLECPPWQATDRTALAVSSKGSDALICHVLRNALVKATILRSHWWNFCNLMFSNTSHTDRQRVTWQRHQGSVDSVAIKSETENWTETTYFKENHSQIEPLQQFLFPPWVCLVFWTFLRKLWRQTKLPSITWRYYDKNFQPSVLLDSVFPSVFNRRSKHVVTSQNTLPSNGNRRTFLQKWGKNKELIFSSEPGLSSRAWPKCPGSSISHTGSSVPPIRNTAPSQQTSATPNQGMLPRCWFKGRNISSHQAISFRKWSFRKGSYTRPREAGSLPVSCEQLCSEENSLFLKQRINDWGRKSRYPKGKTPTFKGAI